MKTQTGRHGRYLLALVFVFCAIQGCSDFGGGFALPPDTSGQITITQGVWGNVWFWSGNFMPVHPTGTITPVRRRIFVYEATHWDSADRATRPVFFTSIHSRLIAQTESNSTGFYQVPLPPGKYSFFVLEDTLFYASEVDSAGDLTAATVLSNNVTKRQIDLQYQAGF